ncbi:hypothetical protein E3N88_16349 [Mikania micrantha]|uniref:Uncharacterized protein n=1 Tax=Mikania micrantha TaxID=192012 RepID=A0A5N6NY78_9ASTR|nr:hypothetical protein E3N88_16349 [Mikania micrantha]
MNQNHIITIDEEIESMKTRMKESPKLLQKSAGNKSCCVFRVPQSLLEINKEAYEPRIVSIGPYHHGKKDLEMIQEHKWRFLQDMLTRTADDPIFKMGWISPFLMRDLLRIENQIPFFVLQKLFQKSEPNSRTLQSLILEFFNHIVERPPEVLNKCENLDGKHLLDFFRESFIHTKKTSVVVPKMIDKTKSLSLKLIQPATKLVNAGVKFKVNHQAQSFLDIEFKNGFLLIPQINMDDFHSSFFMNCMAFEQCYFHCTKDITTYVVFMGCVMNTSTDVGILSHHKIIENYFGTDKEIAKFFKEVGKDVAFDIKTHYLADLFMGVNEYYPQQESPKSTPTQTDEWVQSNDHVSNETTFGRKKLLRWSLTRQTFIRHIHSPLPPSLMVIRRNTTEGNSFAATHSTTSVDHAFIRSLPIRQLAFIRHSLPGILIRQYHLHPANPTWSHLRPPCSSSIY